MSGAPSLHVKKKAQRMKNAEKYYQKWGLVEFELSLAWRAFDPTRNCSEINSGIQLLMDSSVKSFNPNKHLKEQFVSNLTGSSMPEIFLVITTLSILILIRRAICCKNEFGPNAKEASLKKNDDTVVVGKSLRAYMAGIIIDFLIIFVPWSLFLTVLSGWMYLNLTLVILLLLICLAAKRFETFHEKDGVPSLRENVSSYRVSMMLLTCLCILAVDFKIYPRRYAKAETYGTGLMDLGVGSFVLANSFVSTTGKGHFKIANFFVQHIIPHARCFCFYLVIWKRSLRNAVWSSSPLILLGFARLIFTSGVDYQVHVGEYGVHWNFFFTLAAVAILTSLVNLSPKYCGILGLLILAGYWGLYLVGVQLGGYLFFGDQARNMLRANKRARIRVSILCLLFWFLTLFLDQFVEKVSRRMCNMPYVTLILAANLQVLAIIMISDFIPGSKLSLLEEAFNQNLLASFLLANVLTGLVNLSIDTLFISSAFALATLFVYAFTLSISVGFLYFYGIKLKCW